MWTGELLLLLCWIFLPWMVDFLFNHWVILVIVWYTKHLSWKRCWGKGTLAYSILIWPLNWIDLWTELTFGLNWPLDWIDLWTAFGLNWPRTELSFGLDSPLDDFWTTMTFGPKQLFDQHNYWAWTTIGPKKLLTLKLHQINCNIILSSGINFPTLSKLPWKHKQQRQSLSLTSLNLIYQFNWYDISRGKKQDPNVQYW